MNHDMNEFERQLRLLTQVIYDSHNHKINHNLFPPKQLGRELKFVSDQVKHKYQVPDANDVYNIILIAQQITKHHVPFRLSILLFDLNEYDLFRIVPIPFLRNSTFWVIGAEHEYLLVSGNRRTYQFVSEAQLGKCLEYDGNMACDLPLHWHTNNVQQCE